MNGHPSIVKVEDLRRYGIGCLTGESDAYALRLLFDVSEGGKGILEGFFAASLVLEKRWNSDVEAGVPAVGSILLPVEILRPLALYILFQVEGADFAALDPDGRGVTGMAEAERESLPRGWNVRVNWSKRSGHPQRDGRNIHALTGRAS